MEVAVRGRSRECAAGGCAPLHAPLAVQEVALVLLQVSVEVAPVTTLPGLAERDRGKRQRTDRDRGRLRRRSARASAGEHVGGGGGQKSGACAAVQGVVHHSTRRWRCSRWRCCCSS